MYKYEKQYLNTSIKQKYCSQFKISKDDKKCPCNHYKYNNYHKNRGCIIYKTTGIIIELASIKLQITLSSFNQ